MVRTYRHFLLYTGMIALFFFCGAIRAESGQDSNSSRKPLNHSATVDQHTSQEIFVKGKILNLVGKKPVADPVTQKRVQRYQFKVKIYAGEFKGRDIIVAHNEVDNPAFNIKVAPKDLVSVALTVKDGKILDAYIVDIIRENQVYFLLILFIVVLLAIGWRKGAKALCGLLLTLTLIWGVLLPGFLRGYHPILLTILVALISATVTILVIGGISLKSLIAILGTLGGLGISGGLALITGKSAHLTGFGSEEASMLLYIPQNIQLDIQGLLFAGIIIGALGAAMDVSISMASAMEEIKRVCPDIKPGRLIRSGMNVGRDIMGAQASTLILAYTGSSVQLILIFMAYKDPLSKIINLDIVASEIIRALSGSIGMIMVIPLTALVAGILLGNYQNTISDMNKSQPEKPATGAEFLSGWNDPR